MIVYVKKNARCVRLESRFRCEAWLQGLSMADQMELACLLLIGGRESKNVVQDWIEEKGGPRHWVACLGWAPSSGSLR